MGRVNAIQGTGQPVVVTDVSQQVFSLTFEGTTIPQAHVIQSTSVMAIAQASGGLTLNSGSATANTNHANFRTYRHFNLYQSVETLLEMDVKLTNETATNSIIEFGFGFASATSAPTDGAYFRVTAAGVLIGVVNYAGTETTTSALLDPSSTTDTTGLPTTATYHHYRISQFGEVVTFQIDERQPVTLRQSSANPLSASTQAQPVFARVYNSGTASAARQVSVGCINVSHRGSTTPILPTVDALVAAGGTGLQAQPGNASGQTANYANSAAPASASLSNTAAGYSTLGGQWQYAAVAGAETDYALFAYQVPAGTASLPGKTFMCTGIRIGETMVTGAAVVTATNLSWGIAVGSTAVSLATADAAGALAPRRLALGTQAFAAGAAISTIASGFSQDFSAAPLPAHPGQFVHVILKQPFGAATVSLVFRGSVAVLGYFV